MNLSLFLFAKWLKIKCLFVYLPKLPKHIQEKFVCLLKNHKNKKNCEFYAQMLKFMAHYSKNYIFYPMRYLPDFFDISRIFTHYFQIISMPCIDHVETIFGIALLPDGQEL